MTFLIDASHCCHDNASHDDALGSREVYCVISILLYRERRFEIAIDNGLS